MDSSKDESESDLLRHSWERYDAKTLDTYLVSGVEDPRINVPSILTRSMLCDVLFPTRFAALIDEELRFGFVMTWLLKHLEMGVDKASLLAAIRGGRRDKCLDFLLESFRRLQQPNCRLPDYITAALQDDDATNTTALSGDAIDTFRRIWNEELSRLSHAGHSLFEPSCGSANDYRYLDSFGLARFFRYTGLDIAPKNIENARQRYPAVDFRVGDLLDNKLEDNAFDFSFVHDLFEHLSIEAMERALVDLLRVTRGELWLHFFNAANLPQHHVRRVEMYHWNTLSIECLVRIVERAASRVEVVSISELAAAKFGFPRYYNPGAYMIIATNL